MIASLTADCSQAEADDPPGFVFNGANQNMNIEFEGKLAGMEKGMLLIIRDDGVDVKVKMPEDAMGFEFHAPAEVGFLQRGMMVRFSGTFNQSGVPSDPVDGIEIFLRLSEKLAKKKPDQFVPGIYPGEKKPNLPAGVANYKVVGELVGWDATGLVQVQAGQRPVRIQLGEKAKLELRLNNLKLAQQGDAVTVSGSYKLPDDTMVVAKTVTVSTDRVQGAAVENEPVNRSTRRRRRSTPTDADDQKQTDEDEKP